jgi:hypothetical protein
MKATKIMLAVIATFIVTWMSLGFIFYILSDMTYKESLCNPGTGSIMLFIGWLPALIVGADIIQELED